jgi:hypothetical protein
LPIEKYADGGTYVVRAELPGLRPGTDGEMAVLVGPLPLDPLPLGPLPLGPLPLGPFDPGFGISVAAP